MADFSAALPLRAARRRVSLLLSAAFALGVIQCGSLSAAAPKNGIAAAKRAFEKQRWNEARKRYTRLLKNAKDWNKAQPRQFADRAVTCALKLKQWKLALDLAEMFRRGTYKTDDELQKEYLNQQTTEYVDANGWAVQDRRERQAELKRLEFCRGLFQRIARAVTKSPVGFRARLANSRMAGNFRLVAQLESDESGSWMMPSASQDNSWWWEGIPEADRYFKSINDQFGNFGASAGKIPVGKNGRPIFLQAPATYQAARSRGEKILYLLREVGELDATKNRDFAAYAIMLRYDFADRLYGPRSDPERPQNRYAFHVENYSAFASSGSPVGPAKPIEKLNDHETRISVRYEVKVITLPKTHSPLALLRRIEKEFSQSRLVPEAVYRQGTFHQSRRQFQKAKTAYRRLLKRFPKQERAEWAQSRIEEIDRPSVELGPTGVSVAGKKPNLSFACRGTAVVHFTARPFDLAAYIKSEIKAGRSLSFPHFASPAGQAFTSPTGLAAGGAFVGGGQGFFNVQAGLPGAEVDFETEWKKYIGKKTIRWNEAVPRSSVTSRHRTALPATEAGVYLLEAGAPGTKERSRTLVMITGVGLVLHQNSGGAIAWVVDAKTGRPLPGRVVEDFQSESNQNGKTTWSRKVGTTNVNGVVRLKTSHNSRLIFVNDPKNGLAFSVGYDGDLGGFFAYEHDDSSEGRVFWAATDRPLYRPGDTVRFRAWCRYLEGRKFRVPKAGTMLRIEISDDKGETYKEFQLTTDPDGTVRGAFALNKEVGLGEYTISIDENDGDVRPSVSSFRVEEYKKPEFEVTVSPIGERHRLGESIKARVRARYYFGRPVAGAKVSYKVFRRVVLPKISDPHRYDWLYGNGFGLPGHPLASLNSLFRGSASEYGLGSDSSLTSRLFWSGNPDQQIASGTATLNGQGVAEIQFHAKTASGAQLAIENVEFVAGYSYIIKAEVRDDSRRTVEGSGRVVVHNRPFQAHVVTDRNWYQPGRTATVTIATRDDNGAAVATRGRLTLYRVAPDPKGDVAKAPAIQRGLETPIGSWPANSNADGTATHRVPLREPGRYRVVYQTKDAAKQEIRGSIDLWVYGPNLDSKKNLLPELQLIPDRRTYRLGETARVLVVSKDSKPHLLLSNSLSDKYRFQSLAGNAGVLEIRITKKHCPIMALQAVCVRNGRERNAMTELFTPPVQQQLKITLTPDRKTYRPGQKGRVDVQVTDSEGKPVTGELTLTGYDKSLTYIQSEDPLGPRYFLLTQRGDGHALWSSSSLKPQLLLSRGGIDAPEYDIGDDYGPGVQMRDVIGKKHQWRGTRLQIIIRQTQRVHPQPQRIEPFETTLSLVIGSTNRRYGEMGGGFGGGGFGGGGAGFFGGGGFGGGGYRGGGDGGSGRELLPPQLRTDFNDQAIWAPSVKLDRNGRGTAEVTWPQSLTTWNLRGYVVTSSTEVGQAKVEVVTSKNLLVRLQTPRFFVEDDRVVVSANVHNYLKSKKRVTAEIIVPARLFDSAQKKGGSNGRVDREGNLHLTAQSDVGPDGQHRFDWPLRVKSEGLAQITVKALTDEESDAVRMDFPVVPHGVLEQQPFSGSLRAASQQVEFTIPADADPGKTRITVSLAPSAASTMFAALPYLADYPYGCVEQSLSRFYPMVLARRSLKDLGTNLEELEQTQQRRRSRYGRSPVFDSKEVGRMIDSGLQRLYRFQHEDRGWGWWQNDKSSAYMTAYVLLGLHAAAESGVEVRDLVVAEGLSYLAGYSRDANERRSGQHSLHEQAFIAYVITLHRRKHKETKYPLLNAVEKSQAELNNYGKVLLALALHNAGRKKEAQTLLKQILKTAKRDKPKGLSWLLVDKNGWSWWNNKTECNAWMLRALLAIDAKNPRIPEFANWLAAKRRGTHWDSTRSTALAVSALAEYFRKYAADKKRPDVNVAVAIDGKTVKNVRVNRENLLKGRNQIVIPGDRLKPGKHTVTFLTKNNTSTYYSLSVDVLRKPKRILAAGRGIAIARRFYRVLPKPKSDKTRELLRDGAQIAIGDIVEVELHISADADYEYVAFEDPKPAGCEPVQLRSGFTWDSEMYANIELRDRKVVFFASWLSKGKRVLKYRLRAVTPGDFHVLPTRGFAMYAPEIQARSSETRLKIGE